MYYNTEILLLDIGFNKTLSYSMHVNWGHAQ